MSLHSSSAMVGAVELAQVTMQLLDLVRSGQPAAAHGASSQLPSLAAATSAALHDLVTAEA